MFIRVNIISGTMLESTSEYYVLTLAINLFFPFQFVSKSVQFNMLYSLQSFSSLTFAAFCNLLIMLFCVMNVYTLYALVKIFTS